MRLLKNKMYLNPYHLFKCLFTGRIALFQCRINTNWCVIGLVTFVKTLIVALHFLKVVDTRKKELTTKAFIYYRLLQWRFTAIFIVTSVRRTPFTVDDTLVLNVTNTISVMHATERMLIGRWTKYATIVYNQYWPMQVNYTYQLILHDYYK